MQTVSTTTPTPIQAQSTHGFIASSDIVTHLGDDDTTYGSLFNDIAPDLQYLGLTTIRAGADVDLSISSNAAYGLQVESLMSAGIKFDMVVDDNHSVAYYIANFNILEQKYPGSIVSIEGQNEVAPSLIPTYRAFQAQLYAAVRADPLLNGVPVSGFTVYSGDPSIEASMNNDSIEDEGNTHSYTEFFPPNEIQSWAIPLYTTNSPGQPYIVTETGYSTDTTLPPAGQEGNGTDQLTAAKDQLDNLFDLIRDGASNVYIQELLDQQSDPSANSSEFNFGQFTVNNTPKLSAVALHNLTSILADSGSNAASFSPGTLSYSVSGLNSNINPAQLQADYGYGILQSAVAQLPTYGYSYLMEKSNGTFDLAVWAEPIIWDGVTETEIQAPTIPVTVTLGQEAASVEVFDPLVGTSPIATYTDVTTVTVGVVDHPLIIEIDPFPAGSAPAAASSSGTTSSSNTSSSSGTSSSSSGTSSSTTALVPVTPSAPASSSGTVTVGSGPDTIALTMAEDAYQGDAQFVILVNGAQVGGVQTVTAQRGLGQSQVFDVDGTFNNGANAVQVVFTNDLYGGAPNADRNLYLEGASYNTTSNPAAAIAAPSAEDALLSNGTFGFNVNTSVPGTTTVGSGPDWIQLTLAEQAFVGDAQFVVSVDGLQVGGVQTVTAVAAAGESQVFDVMGTFKAGTHDVSIALVNPTSMAGYPLDARSIYVEGASLDGVTGYAATAKSVPTLTTGTADSIAVTDTATPATVLGQGPDTLALFMAEDAYLGNAQFTISVDGQQVGGTQTTGELHGSGQAQEFDILGTFAPGSHYVSVDFLNDASSTPYNAGQDRNLYIDAASINGNTIGGGQIALDNTGSMGFSFNTAGAPAPTVVGGAGPDTLALNVSEDFYQGNAQFTVSVDGTQVGGVQTASAIHGNGQSQVFDLFGSFSGSHSVTVNFVNDAYGTPFAADVDRNLYVGGASVNGSAISNSNLSLLAGGPQSFSFTH